MRKFFLFSLVFGVIFGVVIFSRLWMNNSTRTKVAFKSNIQSKSFNQPAGLLFNNPLGSVSSKLLKGFKSPVANACGTAPSSCVECHNGTMAEKDLGPIHHVHRPVTNITCTTCHRGNGFAIMKSMSHTNLIANPFTTPNVSCEACHSANLSQIVKKGELMEKAFYAANPNAPKLK